MILSVPLAFAVFSLLTASAHTSVPKSSGTVEITDDLAAGSAGSVGLADAGGNIILSGSLGQVAVSSAGLGGIEVESGYFSKYVSTPATLGYGSVYRSSATVTGTAATYPNPSATLYEIETSSALDFSGTIIYGSSTAFPAPLTGLAGNTTYYTRLRASYMGEDPSPYASIALFVTLPALPSPLGFTSVYYSSLTVAWDGTTNSPETLYYAQVGSDPGFTAGAYGTTYASSYTFTSLSPNTTYFVRLKAIGSQGDETAYVLYGSTITTSVTPSTTVPCAVSSTVITGYWSYNGNPYGTRYLAQVSTDNFSTILTSSQTLSASALFTGLVPNTTHYLRVASLNASGAPSLFAALPDALTYAAQPLKQADTFPSVGAFSVTVQWLANSNPPQTEYLAEVSTAADFTAAAEAGFGWASGVSVTADGLSPLTLYYFRAKARNAAGIETAYENLGSTSTITGVDISSPTITDNQAGDMNWRSSNTATYNIDLTDFGGSFLDKLQVRASSGTGGTGMPGFSWSDVVTNINANSYTANWGLTPTQWGLLPSGTSYISVRAYDGVGNYRELADPFYILKDTVAPTVADNQEGEHEWRKTDPGAIYLVNFNDAEGGAGLAAVEYSASVTEGSANGNWTALAGLTPGATYYNGPWALNFSALASGASNYISVRARDLAGNVTPLPDAFIVLKNVSGPAVGITAPGAGFHSALAAVAGTAAPVLEYAITGTEITMQNRSSNQYWDGSGFISASQVWLKATGQLTWTYDTSSITWASGTEYQVVARSSDTALNYSIPYATATFTFDTSVPVVFVSTPAAGTTLETPALISGTAQDSGPNSGVPYIYLTLRRQVDLKWWNFFTNAWVADSVSTMTAGGAAWNFYPDGALRGNLLNNGTYYVYASARDGAIPPNESPAGLYASTFTVIDTVAPGAITAASGAEGALPGRLVVSWTAAGDNGALDMLSDGSWFAINYSTWSGADFSTTAAVNQVLISTAGVMPGSARSHLISDLLPGVTYYLKIWTADEAGLWSGASPLVTARAGISLADSISGYVRMLSGQGVNAIIVEAINRDLAIVKTVTTNDTGYFILAGLDQGIYRVQATCLLNGFASSVASDQIPTGYAEVAFQLSVDYQLASVGGELIGYRLSALPSGGRYAASGAPAVSVELYQSNRLVAVAPVGAGGRFLIKNLLPGSYMLKVPDGAGGYKQLQVSLAPGENLRLSPLGELLKSDKVYAFPNPARRAVTFHLESEQSPVIKQITVFDITGRAIKEFVDGDFTTVGNVSEVVWNIPSGVASGVYIYSTRVKFEATGEYKKTTKKFAIVR
ncbi:MAG: T9SS type A sorting domain-containing protein [Elusimicrobiota bacterium]|nr:T9SS type A sorting domain-containing protein [Elusimicrobiota bacterium]